jgi:CBS domain-containing protein
MSEKLSAGDVCNRIVTIAERNLPVLRAAQLMRDHHVGSLVVVDETGAGRLVVGLLTDRDIVTSVVAMEVDPATLVVEDVMSHDVVTALESDSVSDLLRTMRRKGLRRLPVVTPNGALVGLVTLDDLLSLMAEQLREMALAIEAEQRRELKTRP